jgi:phage-related protein
MVQSENDEKRLRAVFFSNASGNEPVRDWLKSLEREERRTIGVDIKTVEFGWPIGMPTCRSLGRGILEVRSSLPRGRLARVLFCVSAGSMVLLHGFIKKTRATPKADMELAIKRYRQLKAD